MTRPHLTIAAPYAVLLAVVVLFYPTLRGEALLWLYTGAELAGAGFAGWCYVRSSRRRQPPGCEQVSRSDRKGPLPEPALSGDHPCRPPCAHLNTVTGGHDPDDVAALDSDGSTKRPEAHETELKEHQIGADVGSEQLHAGTLSQRRGPCQPSTFCALVLVSTAGAVTLWTALRGLGLIVEQWPAVQGAWSVALAIVVAVQGRELVR